MEECVEVMKGEEGVGTWIGIFLKSNKLSKKEETSSTEMESSRVFPQGSTEGLWVEEVRATSHSGNGAWSCVRISYM